jgi:hypothetical protein
MFDDLEIRLAHRRRSIVLDPGLALSLHGAPIAARLGRAADLWIVPELWHILDNVALSQGHRRPFEEETALGHAERDMALSVRLWERLRSESDLNNGAFFWIGDALRESRLPEAAPPGLLQNCEILAQSFDARGHHARAGRHSPLWPATRDALALSVVLGTGLVLTHLGADGGPPALCRMLDECAVRSAPIDAGEGIAAREREQLRRMAAACGLAKFVFAGLDLAVLQLLVPRYVPFSVPAEPDALPDLEDLPLAVSAALWDDAQGFWYPL